METLGLTGLFEGAYAGRRVLVTGHTGFKGSWLALWLHALGAKVAGFALPADTAPSHWLGLDLGLADETLADLVDRDAITAALARFQPELVLHLAAQPLVRRSYRDPSRTFAVNVGGLVNLFEAVRACPSVRAVLNVTTDKVYEPPCPATGYAESHALGGHDPYSASKACAEIVSASYRRSFFQAGTNPTGVALATARAGNVVGGGDWAEDRLVPDLVRAIAADRPLALRNPGATRPWQHVLEPLAGYLEIGRRLLAGEAVAQAWNLGPATGDVLSVHDVVQRLRRHWPDLQVQSDAGPHPHEAPELVLDSRAADAALGWRPVWDAGQAMDRTAAWYRDFLRHGHGDSVGDLTAYVRDARVAGLAWAGG
ncbi:CDP-glucose 4,6-dehydratase [Arenimonas soli]|uniref:CDP-glucose 4,6-dehydratase n=1 Tax=Arenimonas soli TaxID=2269504 RepID=UPI001E55813C|nr:CDP-glucose 4,6-dehydratase [Arenimonas soli]